MRKHLICSAALLMPLIFAAPVLAQTATTPGAAPAAPMAHSTTAAPAIAPAPAPAPAMAAPETTSAADLSATDKKFALKAAQGGMAEVQLAQLAQQKGSSDTVKKFAQQMIDDHTPANDKLTKIATAKGLTPPTDLDAMDQKMMTKLQGLDGAKFDKAYLSGQLKAHKAMLKEFQTESKSGKDPDLKAFADDTIPVIQKHITMAQSGKSGTM